MVLKRYGIFWSGSGLFPRTHSSSSGVFDCVILYSDPINT